MRTEIERDSTCYTMLDCLRPPRGDDHLGRPALHRHGLSERGLLVAAQRPCVHHLSALRGNRLEGICSPVRVQRRRHLSVHARWLYRSRYETLTASSRSALTLFVAEIHMLYAMLRPGKRCTCVHDAVRAPRCTGGGRQESHNPARRAARKQLRSRTRCGGRGAQFFIDALRRCIALGDPGGAPSAPAQRPGSAPSAPERAPDWRNTGCAGTSSKEFHSIACEAEMAEGARAARAPGRSHPAPRCLGGIHAQRGMARSVGGTGRAAAAAARSRVEGLLTRRRPCAPAALAAGDCRATLTTPDVTAPAATTTVRRGASAVMAAQPPLTEGHAAELRRGLRRKALANDVSHPSGSHRQRCGACARGGWARPPLELGARGLGFRKIQKATAIGVVGALPPRRLELMAGGSVAVWAAATSWIMAAQRRPHAPTHGLRRPEATANPVGMRRPRGSGEPRRIVEPSVAAAADQPLERRSISAWAPFGHCGAPRLRRPHWLCMSRACGRLACRVLCRRAESRRTGSIACERAQRLGSAPRRTPPRRSLPLLWHEVLPPGAAVRVCIRARVGPGPRAAAEPGGRRPPH